MIVINQEIYLDKSFRHAVDKGFVKMLLIDIIFDIFILFTLVAILVFTVTTYDFYIYLSEAILFTIKILLLVISNAIGVKPLRCMGTGRWSRSIRDLKGGSTSLAVWHAYATIFALVVIPAYFVVSVTLTVVYSVWLDLTWGIIIDFLLSIEYWLTLYIVYNKGIRDNIKEKRRIYRKSNK